MASARVGASVLDSQAIKESGGFSISVSDEQIIQAIPELAREASVFGEPAGVTSPAALQKAVRNDMIKHDEKVIVLITGSGLKDINSAMKSVGKPLKIQPDMKELEKIIPEDLI